MEIVRVEGLKKYYGTGEATVKAVDGVSLSISRGEFVSIIGASGSGKSTLLHILGGVESPDFGQIIIDGENILSYDDDQLAMFRRRKVGLVYQFYNLIQNLSVEKNILLPLMLDKRRVNVEVFQDLVEKLGLSKLLKKFPGQLSGGQQQRVAIARSIIYEPALVLADEPTGNLDRENTDEIMNIFKYANRNYNRTIVMVTHDERIALMGSRIIVLSDGMVVEDELL